MLRVKIRVVRLQLDRRELTDVHRRNECESLPILVFSTVFFFLRIIASASIPSAESFHDFVLRFYVCSPHFMSVDIVSADFYLKVLSDIYEYIRSITNDIE